MNVYIPIIVAYFAFVSTEPSYRKNTLCRNAADDLIEKKSLTHLNCYGHYGLRT